jgi:excisionase family DNA binding protein
MSIEHAPERQKRKRVHVRKPVARICVSVIEFCAATGLSRPTVYRLMQTGKLRYVQLSDHMRKIPVSEYARLGLTGDR